MTSKPHPLIALLASKGPVAVAFSGGVDSSLVALAAYKAMGDNAIALTGDSPSVPRRELEQARKIAQQIGIRHQILGTDEFQSPDYVKNDGSRCYFCKSELYSQIHRAKALLGFQTICSGANLDDLGDYRPGLSAATEAGICHPLIEASMTKAMVRELALEWGLEIWDKPASPCLSSRIAPNLSVTPERTLRVEKAEDLLHDLGYPVCRVRYFPGDVGRIEVPKNRLPELVNHFKRVKEFLLTLGFVQVEIDPEGFRSGNLNQLIPLTQKMRWTQPA